jgi:hypothetical protein
VEKREYKTEEQKFLDWYEGEKASNGLIDVKFHPGDLNETDQELFYKEANYFNEQLDRKDITARIQVIL